MIDNDCDGAVDEPGSGTQIWYADSDGDVVRSSRDDLCL